MPSFISSFPNGIFTSNTPSFQFSIMYKSICDLLILGMDSPSVQWSTQRQVPSTSLFVNQKASGHRYDQICQQFVLESPSHSCNFRLLPDRVNQPIHWGKSHDYPDPSEKLESSLPWVYSNGSKFANIVDIQTL